MIVELFRSLSRVFKKPSEYVNEKRTKYIRLKTHRQQLLTLKKRVLNPPSHENRSNIIYLSNKKIIGRTEQVYIATNELADIF